MGFSEIMFKVFGGVGEPISEDEKRQPGETYGEYRQRLQERHDRIVASYERARKGSFRLAGKIWRSLWGISGEEEEE